MFTLFFRAMLLYAVMILSMRALGKHQLGEFQPYELAFTILLADIISGPIGGVNTPLLYGLLPVAAVIVVHGVLTLICMKSDRMRAIISGKPAVVISRGVINRNELNRLCLSLSDLLAGLRSAGDLDPKQVGTAIIEANGAISAFPAAEHRPAETGDLNVQTEYEGLPLTLIMDGRAQDNNLRTAGKDRRWLTNILNGRGIACANVYLASLDTMGQMHLQLRDQTVMRFPARQPQEVIC